ncbi:nuclear assembly factor 1 [Striga asiatica]|uniref:Nuclear assembly factor 1 n=1 Tax=Striga asiatica TaxID=4170 RepID=A0A5A7QIX3_STRAF|nr:nuclear assembly factor 1 [Striga asiatica]
MKIQRTKKQCNKKQDAIPFQPTSTWYLRHPTDSKAGNRRASGTQYKHTGRETPPTANSTRIDGLETSPETPQQITLRDRSQKVPPRHLKRHSQPKDHRHRKKHDGRHKPQSPANSRTQQQAQESRSARKPTTTITAAMASKKVDDAHSTTAIASTPEEQHNRSQQGAEGRRWPPEPDLRPGASQTTPFTKTW